MTLPLPWTVVNGQTGELADTQAAYRLLMPAAEQAVAGWIAGDSFTRPDSATLDNAETGQTWELQAGAFAIASGVASSSASSQAVLNVGKPDVDVTCLITPTSGAPGIVVRSDISASGTTNNTRLAVQLDMTNGFRLNKTEAGTGAALQTSVFSFVAGTTYVVRAIAVGNRILGYLNGAQLIDYTLTAGEVTTFGALTRVGLRNTGVATFDDFIVRIGYPTASSGGAETLATLPAGLVVYSLESAGAYVRPTARTDDVCLFIGTANPGATALENDIWVRTP